MAAADAELEQRLKEAGKQLSHPPGSVDELLPVLDEVEKLLLKVDQSPKKSMLEALKPSMNALIQDSLLKHSDMDVNVAVASCISEITRITAPDAPYTDDQMRDVFQLIASSFEDLADQSSRSYSKRASILETVSKVRSCVIMLDLECDELIVKMFEHFLKSVRDYHLDSVYSSMENIMVLVIEESEEVSADMLKPLLASVKKDREGVLPIAHKLGKGVLLKSAEKLKPYMMPALTSLGESLDMYHKVVAAICEGTAAKIQNNDDNDSGLQVANECKMEKGSVDEAQQADESKLTTASSDQVDQVVKEEASSKEEVNPTMENKSSKSVMSNGGDVMVDQESKKTEDKSQESLNKEDTEDSGADELAKEKPPTEKTSKQSEKEADAITNSVEPSDSSHVEGDKEIEKDNDVKESENEKEKDNDIKESENQNEKDNDVKESGNEAVIPSETEKDKDSVQEVSPKAVESKPAATANVSSSQNKSVLDETSGQSEKKPVPEEDETASPSKSGLSAEAQKQVGKKTAISNEVKDTENKSEDGDDEASSDSDAKPLKMSDLSKSTKRSGKKSKQSGKKLDVGGSDAKKAKQSGKKVDVKGEESDSDAKPLKQSVKKGEKSNIAAEEEKEDDSDDKPLKMPAKKSTSKKKDEIKNKSVVEEEEEDDSDNKPLKLPAKKSTSKKKDDIKNKTAVEEEEEDDSDNKLLKLPAKKSSSKNKDDGKNKLAVEKEEDYSSDEKPVKLPAKKSTSKKKGDEKKKIAVVEEEGGSPDEKPLAAKVSTSKKKDDGKKRGNGKNVAEKDQTKSLSGDDKMVISPKSATKSAKGEGNSTKTPVTSGKRKGSTGKNEVSDKIKYDESLVGKKVKVWWPEDEMFYEGVVSEFYPAKKKHKVSYLDGDEEKLNLKTQRWEILQEFSEPANEEQNTEPQTEAASPEIHKKKKSKTDPAASQEKTKDSAKSKSKGSTAKDNKSTPKTSSKSADTVATTSKEAEKSKEDEDTPKTSSKTKTVNKSKGKTPPSSKSNANGPTKAKSGSSNVKEPEDVKSAENSKGGSKSGKKRKKT